MVGALSVDISKIRSISFVGFGVGNGFPPSNKHRFDRIKKAVEDGALVVTGRKMLDKKPKGSAAASHSPRLEQS